MKAYKVTTTDMENALRQVNVKYNDNVIWKRFDQNGSGVHFTLTVKSSKGKGGRLSPEQRRIAAACWHVHGDFFDALFAIAPNAYVRSMGRKITKDEGNWQDPKHWFADVSVSIFGCLRMPLAFNYTRSLRRARKMNTQDKINEKPKAGRERLILHTDGKHYWLQSDGSMRATDWILRDGLAVLTGSIINTENL